MNKLSIRNLEVQGKEVLMRCDFNVPLKDGAITDDSRITGALPSIKLLLEKGAKLVLCSHMGRPKGQVNLEYSLKPVAVRLSELLGQEVVFAEDTIGEASMSARANLEAGEAVLIENTRFAEEETANDATFAKALAGNAEVFVNDAFGTAHRAHASTEGVTHHVSQSAMGLLIEKELEFLVGKLESPESPFAVIIGGKKVSDKIKVIDALLDKADIMIIGGAMSYTFRVAQGYEVGDSLVQQDKVELAGELMKKAEEKGVKFMLPRNTRITQEFSPDAETKCTISYEDDMKVVPAGWEGVDIGDEAITEYCEVLKTCKTVLWNGPMGVFELDNFGIGTKAVAETLANMEDATTIVGGGDSVTAANKYGLVVRNRFYFESLLRRGFFYGQLKLPRKSIKVISVKAMK